MFIKTLAITVLMLYAVPLRAQQQPLPTVACFSALADSAAAQLAAVLPPAAAVNLRLAGPEVYAVFREWVAAGIRKRGCTLTTEGGSTAVLTITEASTVYGELYKEKFFGGYYTPRQARLSGQFIVAGNVVPFSCSVTDTIAAARAAEVQAPAYPFTMAELPAEPFWGSIVEPVAVLGAAAVTVYLFFTVRSK